MAGGQYEWEECVNQVCVTGSPSAINEVNAGWSLWLTYLNDIGSALGAFKSQIGASFSGPAGDAYQAHLGRISTMIEEMDRNHRPVQDLLSEAGRSLANAQAAMPIPETMLDEVTGRSAEHNAANRSSLDQLVLSVGGVAGLGYQLLPGDFRNSVADSWAGNFARETVGQLHDWFNDWSGEQTEKANQILSQVNSEQSTKVATTESPSGGGSAAYYDDVSSPPLSTGAGGGGGGAGGMPSMGGGAGGMGSGSVSPSAASSFDAPKGSSDGGAAGIGVGETSPYSPPRDFDSPGSTTSPYPGGGGSGGVGSGGFDGGGVGSGSLGSGAGYDPSGSNYSAEDWQGTGLAGAGSSGGGAAGLGSSGLSSGLGAGGAGGGLAAGGGAGGGLGAGGAGGGLGAGGLGAGALGAGSLGGAASGAGGKGAIGKAVSMPMPPLAGAGGLAAAGGSGRGAGAGRGLAAGTGMMGAGAGAGNLSGNESSRDTWLHEDEDVWGTGDTTTSNWSWDDA